MDETSSQWVQTTDKNGFMTGENDKKDAPIK